MKKVLLMSVLLLVSLVLVTDVSLAANKLACVTGSMSYGIDNGIGIPSVAITNQKNISISWWKEVFTQDTYDPYYPGDLWGLICKDEWVNTGCSQHSNGTPDDFDLPEMNNGCFTDDEELDYLVIYTTCCKITDICEYLHIPPGHLPPPGECKLWNPNIPPGHQGPPVSCEIEYVRRGLCLIDEHGIVIE